jgi:hypothetical protein
MFHNFEAGFETCTGTHVFQCSTLQDDAVITGGYL